MDFYSKEISAVFKELGSSDKGLLEEEAKARLKRHGFNELKEEKKVMPLKIFLKQFKSLLVWILIIAVIISALIGDYVESIVILIIIVANAVIGFVQEYRAEKAIAALKKLASHKAVVLRDNKKMSIAAVEVVPGDIIFLESGDKVPADARLIEAVNLESQESALTGESVPVSKEVCVLKKVEIAEQKNMVFSGTAITRGKAKAVVVATGMSTEIGKIAKMISEVEETTPLQLRLDAFAKFLGIAAIAICAVVFSLNVLRGNNVLEMFKTAISLAVAAVPEGLPAVVTLSLALSVQKMVKRNALIRKLPAVETLGSVTVICSDKTGTLTCDQMTVKKIFVDNEVIGVSGEGYSFEGGFSKRLGENAQFLLKIGALCNDAEINEGVVGDPTEAALIVSAAKAGFKKYELENSYPRITEIPFDSERKRMSTIHELHGKRFMYTKGAVDVILHLCDKILVRGKIKKLSKKDKVRILKVNEEFAGNALRVLGFAFKEVKGQPAEKDLVFVGMQGMIDPAREEVKEAVAQCEKAGIRVIMITGDHKETAVAIAKQIGIEGKAITGEELTKIKNLSKIIDEVSIYARVNPAHKIRIIDALKKKNHFVAMTGDGVNDAPALKKADIGVAMGITGTDVAKEASDMILMDDNFTSIRNAVEEGRVVFDNIKKFVFFLLSSNLSEVLIIFIATLAGLRLPLVAIQILWVNLMTDMFPALALGAEKPEKDIMLRKPRKYGEQIVDKDMIIRLLMITAVITAGTLTLFFWALQRNGYVYATTVAFTSLVFFEMFNAVNAKSENKSCIGQLFSNKYLFLAIISSIVLQLIVVITPLNSFFHAVQIKSVADWLIIVGIASSVLLFDETRKLSVRFINRG